MLPYMTTRALQMSLTYGSNCRKIIPACLGSNSHHQQSIEDGEDEVGESKKEL